MTTRISLCSNSHREIPVMNTGSLQWEEGFPVMKTGFSLWELLHREKTGPVRDCSAHILEDLSQSENVSEIKPPLRLTISDILIWYICLHKLRHMFRTDSLYHVAFWEVLTNFSFTAVGKHEFCVLSRLILWVDIYFLLTLLHGARQVWKYYNIYYATLRLPLLPLEWWRMYGKLWMTFLATTDKNRTVISDRAILFTN